MDEAVEVEAVPVATAVAANALPASLDRPQRTDDGVLANVLPAPEWDPESIDGFTRHETLLRAVRDLPPLHARVVRGRLKGLTLSEVGSSVGLSRERVRQIEQEAVERLRGVLTCRAA